MGHQSCPTLSSAVWIVVVKKLLFKCSSEARPQVAGTRVFPPDAWRLLSQQTSRPRRKAAQAPLLPARLPGSRAGTSEPEARPALTGASGLPGASPARGQQRRDGHALCRHQGPPVKVRLEGGSTRVLRALCSDEGQDQEACSLQWHQCSGLEAPLQSRLCVESRPACGQAAEDAGRPGPQVAVGAAAGGGHGGQGRRTESLLAPEAVREPHQLHREPAVGTDGRASLARLLPAGGIGRSGRRGGG